MVMTATLGRDNRSTYLHPRVFKSDAFGRHRSARSVDLNLQAYVGADPVNFIDPYGLCAAGEVPVRRPRTSRPDGDVVALYRIVCMRLPRAESDTQVGMGDFLGGIGTALDDFADKHLKPPEGRRRGESRRDCVSRIAGDTPTLGVAGTANLAAGGALLPYSRTPLAGGGGGTSLISSAARGSFGGAKMPNGMLGTGSIGGAVGRAISRFSVVTGTAVLGWATGKLAGAAEKCR